MTMFVRSPDIEAAPMMEETILYSPDAKQFCVLNPTAAHLWERLGTPATADDLAASVREAFAADDHASVESDVSAILQQFESLRMVRQHESA